MYMASVKFTRVCGRRFRISSAGKCVVRAIHHFCTVRNVTVAAKMVYDWRNRFSPLSYDRYNYSQISDEFCEFLLLMVLVL